MMHEGYTVRDAQFWRIVGSLALASLFIFAAMYSVQPLFPLFTKEFNISVSYASMSISMTTFGLIIGLVVLGFFSDRNGRTIYIKLSLICVTIPFILMAQTENFLLIVILRFIQGFALAGVPAAALAYIGEEINKNYISVATALYISSNALGGMVGRVMTGFITEQYSWEISFYILASIGAFLFVIVWIMLPKSRNFTQRNDSFIKDIEGFIFHLKSPGLLLIFGLGIVSQMSFTGIWTSIPFHLTGPPFSLSLKTISYLFFAYGFGVIGTPIAGSLAEKYGLHKVRVVGIFILSAGILLTLSASFSVVVVGLCLSCLGFFTAHSLSAALVSKSAIHHKGSAASLYLVSYYIGVAAGSTILSPLWQSIGWKGFVYVTAVLPIIYILTLRKKEIR